MLPLIGDIDTVHYTSDKCITSLRDWLRSVAGWVPDQRWDTVVWIYWHRVFRIRVRENRWWTDQNWEEWQVQNCTSDWTIWLHNDEDQGRGCRLRHGPATVLVDRFRTRGKIAGRRYETAVLSQDSVECYRSMQWPPQAAEWLARHRKYGCPDTATIQRIVNNGCDLVFTTHRQCKQNEQLRERMWRISFSRAETSLLNS